MAPPNVRISKKLASAKKSLSRDKSSGDDNTNDYNNDSTNISSSSQQQPPPAAPSNITPQLTDFYGFFVRFVL